MMRRARVALGLATLGLLALAPAARAEGVTINGCTLLGPPHQMLTCRLSNGTAGTITFLHSTIELVEPGRDESWAVIDDGQHIRGIEPGETEFVNFDIRIGVPDEAWTHPLAARLMRLWAPGDGATILFDETTVPTIDPSHPMEPPFPGALLYTFERDVLACWDPGRLTPAASDTWVSLLVPLDRTGHVAGEIELENHIRGDDAAVQEAFDLAREATLRCLADGYDLPQDMYGQWRQVRVNFDPKPLAVE